jgi:hypothetical protein
MLARTIDQVGKHIQLPRASSCVKPAISKPSISAHKNGRLSPAKPMTDARGLKTLVWLTRSRERLHR